MPEPTSSKAFSGFSSPQQELSDDSDYKPTQSTRRKKIRSNATRLKATTKAKIGRLAETEHDDVVGKVKQTLTLAFHEDSKEEADKAFRHASKLMKQHSIAESETKPKSRLVTGGSSTVFILSTIGASRVFYDKFAWTIARAMVIFYNVKSIWNDRHKRIKVRFYGLCEQTVAAAYSFEMAYNLIAEWSYKQKDIKTEQDRDIYRVGAAEGLEDLAEQEKEEELATARQREQREERLNADTQTEMEDDEEYNQLLSDSEEPNTEWSSERSLLDFRHLASAIADEYLYVRGVEPESPEFTSNPLDLDGNEITLHEKGRRDAEKINVKKRKVEQKLAQH